MALVPALIGASMVVNYLSGKKQTEAAEDASRRSARAVSQAQAKNEEFARWLDEQQAKDTQPWRDIGLRALQDMETKSNAGAFDIGKIDITEDPGFEYRYNMGQKQLDRSAAARGRLLSGATLRASQREGQELASQEYGNAFNRRLATVNNDWGRYATMAGIGQNALSARLGSRATMGQTIVGGNTATGNAIANSAAAAGDARASQYGGLATAANQGIQNYLLWDMYGKNQVETAKPDTTGGVKPVPTITPTATVGGNPAPAPVSIDRLDTLGQRPYSFSGRY